MGVLEESILAWRGDFLKIYWLFFKSIFGTSVIMSKSYFSGCIFGLLYFTWKNPFFAHGRGIFSNSVWTGGDDSKFNF